MSEKIEFSEEEMAAAAAGSADSYTRAHLDELSDHNMMLEQSKALLEEALEKSDTRVAVLEKQVRELKGLGWNEARAAKCRMLEHWQSRFVNIMAQHDGYSADTLARLMVLYEEMGWSK